MKVDDDGRRKEVKRRRTSSLFIDRQEKTSIGSDLNPCHGILLSALFPLHLALPLSCISSPSSLRIIPSSPLLLSNQSPIHLIRMCTQYRSTVVVEAKHGSLESVSLSFRTSSLVTQKNKCVSHSHFPRKGFFFHSLTHPFNSSTFGQFNPESSFSVEFNSTPPTIKQVSKILTPAD